MVEYKMNHMVVIRLRGVDSDLAFADILDHLVRLSPRYVKSCFIRLFGHFGREQQAVNTTLTYYHVKLQISCWRTNTCL